MQSRMLELSCALLNEINDTMNDALKEYSPTALIAGTLAVVLTLQQVYALYRHWDRRTFQRCVFDNTVKSLLFLPVIGQKVRTELNAVNKALDDIRADIDRARSHWTPIRSLPEHGLSHNELMARFDKLEGTHRVGRLSGAVYAHYDQDLLTTLEKIWGKTALTNPMHEEWPLINLMEAEVISICQTLMHGTQGAPGIMTHGGSTSILEACKAYVIEARKKGISEPEIIAPETVHVAFDKAATILNFKLVKIPTDQYSGAADVNAMAQAVNSNTCLLVGSAPSFPFGIMDPITEMGALAQRKKIPLHVDCCLGGFINAFAEEAGFTLPKFDFSAAGVTSLSMDTHKYGQTPKGTSVLLFHPDCQASPTHVHLDWVGGMYVSEGIDGSRSGADIATTLAVLCAKGKSTFVKETHAILTLQRELVKAINQIEGIQVAFQPQSSVVGVKANLGINILVIANQLKEKGWSVNIIQTSDQKASGFHFCLTAIHAHQENFTNEFISDLKAAVAYAKANPKAVVTGMAKVYGKLEKGIPHFLQERIGRGYIEAHNTIRQAIKLT